MAGSKRFPKQPANEYWILDRKQIRCLSSARRSDMLDRLAASGPLSARELAGEIGMQPPAVYRHLQLLAAVGLVVEAGVRTTGRKPEKLYATPAPRMRLVHALGDPRFKTLCADLAGALGRQMARDFQYGVRHPAAEALGPRRNLGIVRVLGAPGPKALAAINKHFEAILELMFTERAPEAPFLAVTWTLAPVRARNAVAKAPSGRRKGSSRARR